MIGFKARTDESRGIGRALSVLALAAACLAGGCASPAVLAIVDVSVVDVDAGVLIPHQTVLVRGERIAVVAPTDALRLATAGAADFLGLGRQFGRIRKGMEADLVLLDGNPLEDVAALREITAVVLRGQLLDRNALDRMASVR